MFSFLLDYEWSSSRGWKSMLIGDCRKFSSSVGSMSALTYGRGAALTFERLRPP
jgi:hypothetical protein